MVKAVFILALALLPLSSLCAPQLSLTLSKTETQLGKPVRAELTAVGASEKLADLDLQPLRESFGVEVEESIAGQTEQRLRLRLYPRQTGELTVPALRLGEARSAPQAVRVNEGPMTVTTRLSESSPWERQQVVFQLEITTPDLFATLAADGMPAVPDVDFAQQIFTRERTDKSAVLRLAWALAPQTAGAHNFELPPVRYTLSGRTERVYYFPKVTLQVRPLPPYIPPTLPVGRVSVTSRLSASGLLSPDALIYWTVTVAGETITPNGLPSVLQQVQSGERIRFLSVDSSREWRADERRSTVTHHIPLKPLASGPLALPTLQFHTFDPGTGRLVRVTHAPPRPWVLGLGWRIALMGGMGCAALWLGWRLHLLTLAALERRRRRKAALVAIRQAADPRQLRRALEDAARAEGFPANLSLREWAGCWRARHGGDVDDVMRRLSLACYGGPSVQQESAELKEAVCDLYRGR